MNEYDRWYRRYQRRRRIAQIAGTLGMCLMVAGAGFLLYIAISTAIIVFS